MQERPVKGAWGEVEPDSARCQSWIEGSYQHCEGSAVLECLYCGECFCLPHAAEHVSFCEDVGPGR